MSRLLRHLSPGAQAFWLEHGWTIPAVLLIALAGVGVLWLAHPEPFRVEGYDRATVLSAFDTSADDGHSWTFVVQLSDGRTISVATRDLALATTMTATACLERRRHDSGKASYRLAPPRLCEGA